ncbi:MAG: response regulator [Leptothrix ochracea]|uniref:response regulator n=1 Tax=Leptothrix ochracea TaxID=735331 RepID=UPI0034E28B44
MMIPPQAPLSLILIDDHSLCRRGLTELLQAQAGMNVLGATGDPHEALALLTQRQPDLIVMDLRMPMLDGLSLLRRIRSEGFETPVLILTMSDSQEDMGEALRAGARGYLLKDMDPDDVISAIQRCARGEMVVAPAMSAKLSNLLRHGQHDTSKNKAVRLTERESEILQYLASGRSNKAIAKSLDISHDTVKLHVRHILAKLNLSSRVEAAVYAVEHGVTPLHDAPRPPPSHHHPL